MSSTGASYGINVNGGTYTIADGTNYSGSFGPYFNVYNGGVLSADGAFAINISGGGAQGLVVNGAGSAINFTTYSGARSLKVDGGGAVGITANGSSVTIEATTATPFELIALGASTIGVQATNNATVNITNANILAVSKGLYITNATLVGSGLYFNQFQQNVSGFYVNRFNTNGIFATNSIATISDTTFSSWTIRPFVIFESAVTISDTYADLTTDNATGIFASNTSDTITSGAGPVVVSATSKTNIDVTDSSIITQGTSSSPLAILGAVEFSSQRGSFQARGTTSHAINLRLPANSPIGAAAAKLTFNGTQISASDGNLFNITGQSANITLNGVTATASTGKKVMALTADTALPTNVSLTLDQSSLITGDITSETAADLQISLIGASTLIGSITSATKTKLSANSIWNIAGNSNVSELVNSGTISFQAPVAGSFKTLTIGNLTAGGAVTLNTQLGNDSSPTDQIIITGGVSALNPDGSNNQTTLTILNAGGTGATTTGDGIQVVKSLNGAQTHSDSFVLSHAVIEGAYEYSLYRGTRSDSATPDANSWYLSTDKNRSASNNNGNTPSPPNNTPSPPSNTPSLPNYRMETSLISTLPEMALSYSEAMLGMRYDRNYSPYGQIAAPAGDMPLERTMWARMIGKQIDDKKSSGGVYDNGAAHDQTIKAIQMGMDLVHLDDGTGSQDVAGIYFGLGQSDGRVIHHTGEWAGNMQFDGYTAGAYWLHQLQSGLWFDTVLQNTWLNADAVSARGLPFETDGYVATASMNIGYPISLDEGMVLEPQAQFIYQNGSLGDHQDAAAYTQFQNTESLSTRLGARISGSWNNETDYGSQKITLAGTLNYGHEFLGKPSTLFSTASSAVPFSTNMKGSWVEIGGSINVQLTTNMSMFANASYSISEGKSRTSLDGQIGLRVTW